MSLLGWLLVGLGGLLVLSTAVALGAGAALSLVAKADPFDGCPHGVDGAPDELCARFGCPDDPAWIGGPGMSAVALLALGAGGMLVLGGLLALVSREGRESLAAIFGGLLVAAVCPILVLAELLRRAGLIAGGRVDPRTFVRFARLHERGPGKPFVLFYAPRLGVIFVHPLRHNGPVPPVRVRSTADDAERIP